MLTLTRDEDFIQGGWLAPEGQNCEETEENEKTIQKKKKKRCVGKSGTKGNRVAQGLSSGFRKNRLKVTTKKIHSEDGKVTPRAPAGQPWEGRGDFRLRLKTWNLEPRRAQTPLLQGPRHSGLAQDRGNTGEPGGQEPRSSRSTLLAAGQEGRENEGQLEVSDSSAQAT